MDKWLEKKSKETVRLKTFIAPWVRNTTIDYDQDLLKSFFQDERLRENKGLTWLYSDVPNIKPQLRHKNRVDVIPSREREKNV